MRFATSGDLRRLDLSPVIELLPALRHEWASLEFDRAGQVLNALTGEPDATFALIDGRHRQAGAQYRATVTTPTYGLPESRRTEFDEESRRLRHRKAAPEAWDNHHARRREAIDGSGGENRG